MPPPSYNRQPTPTKRCRGSLCSAQAVPHHARRPLRYIDLQCIAGLRLAAARPVTPRDAHIPANAFRELQYLVPDAATADCSATPACEFAEWRHRTRHATPAAATA